MIVDFFLYKKQKVFEEKRFEFDLAERIEFPSVIDDATKNQSKTNTFVTFFWHVIHAHDDSEINFLAFRLTRWVASHRTMHTIWKFIFLKECTRTVFENHRKSLIQNCERSELRLHFEWTKIN